MHDRQTELRFILAPLDTTQLTTQQVVDVCREAVPGASIPEIVEALRAVAQEHYEHASVLERFKQTRIKVSDPRLIPVNDR